MSSSTKASSKNTPGLSHTSSAAKVPAPAPVNSTETGSGAAAAKAIRASEKKSASPVNFRAFTYFGGIAEGHYTEF